MKEFVKRCVLSAEAACLQGATSLTRGKFAQSLTILTFHRVLPEQLRSEYAFPELAVTPQELSGIIRWAKEVYAIDTVSRQVEQLARGRSSGPLMAITFDDGQWDNYRYAAPALRALGVKATFYLPVSPMEEQRLIWHDWIGFGLPWCSRNCPDGLSEHWPASVTRYFEPRSAAEALKAAPDQQLSDLVQFIEGQLGTDQLPEWSRLMTYTEAGELARFGHEIGSHAMSHRILTNIPPEQAEREICESRSRLETTLGVGIESFCYPNGNHNASLEAACERAGYSNATSTQMGLNWQSDIAPYSLRRINIDATSLLSPRGRFSISRARTHVRQSSLIQTVRRRRVHHA